MSGDFNYMLRIDLTDDDYNKTSLQADYLYFAVGSESDKYRLALGSYDENSSLGK